MSAPSCMNSREWEFIVIRDKQTLRDISEFLEGNGRMLPTADVGIVVCGNTGNAYKKFPSYWVIDCSLAAENIIIAAEALGLGGVMLGVYPETVRMDGISEYFCLPESIIPLMVLSIGVPAAKPASAVRYCPEKVHFEGWK